MRYVGANAINPAFLRVLLESEFLTGTSVRFRLCPPETTHGRRKERPTRPFGAGNSGTVCEQISDFSFGRKRQNCIRGRASKVSRANIVRCRNSVADARDCRCDYRQPSDPAERAPSGAVGPRNRSQCNHSRLLLDRFFCQRFEPRFWHYNVKSALTQEAVKWSGATGRRRGNGQRAGGVASGRG